MNASAGTATQPRRVLTPGGVVLLTLSALSAAAEVSIYGDAMLHPAGTGAALGGCC